MNEGLIYIGHKNELTFFYVTHTFIGVIVFRLVCLYKCLPQDGDVDLNCTDGDYLSKMINTRAEQATLSSNKHTTSFTVMVDVVNVHLSIISLGHPGH